MDYTLLRARRASGIALRAGGRDSVSVGPAARTIDRAVCRREIGAVIHGLLRPQYPAAASAVTHNVSVIDLLFGVGPAAPQYLSRAGHPVVA